MDRLYNKLFKYSATFLETSFSLMQLQLIIGFDKFKKEIEILSILEIKLVKFIDCPQEKNNRKLEKLKEFFNGNLIQQNYYTYEGLLRLLNQLSLNRPILKVYFDKVFLILEMLIKEFSLQQIFETETIFSFFRDNKIVLRFLLENHIIEYQLLHQHLLFQDGSWLYYFFPEIKQNILTYFENKKCREDIKKYEDNLEDFMRIRSNIIQEDLVIRYIQDDNLNKFIEHVSFTDMPLNKSISKPIFDHPYFHKRNYNEITLIEYSMIFGAIKIFKYLMMNKVNITTVSLHYAILGNNTEIIQIIEDQGSFSFDISCLNIAIQCHHHKLIDYIISKMEAQNVEINDEDLLLSFIKNSSYYHLNQFFLESNQEYFLHFTKTAKELSRCIDSFSMLSFFSYLFSQSEYDINEEDEIFICFI
ncbi:hypothetical protein TRFO_10832 [Tritrichomonas foetus]|uniref:DUF3447 domain-containing protein n=1 Tax=Tritrichomonas foetus TaxID=1144522 RepID=A0A1J4JB58_9EUKA|nr:hypothetical protein TRFO_10832 [Tritrichomonas foetus]|eukprot:OHS94891.1 hypothetical protein TRFO_10832 [Tritrichomonas foetus]